MCGCCYRGHRYCSQACRGAARKESNDKARKAYEKSLADHVKKHPKDAEAEREDQRRRQKAYRVRAREKKAREEPRVTEQGRQTMDAASKMESGGEATPPGPDAGPLERPAPVTEPVVTRSTRARTDGTSGRGSPTGYCCVCGRHGRICWRVPADAGNRHVDRERFTCGDDP
jgi:hypothetical protein